MNLWDDHECSECGARAIQAGPVITVNHRLRCRMRPGGDLWNAAVQKLKGC